MADNTVADLPTKNAAPAEPAKSLAATVQQVMTKAVTSPTDAKVDFAQGVNHITGDPQQKSAGTADEMPTLKAEADPKKSYSNANEAEEKKDKEKEDMKEVADKEDEKKKDEMKEGEMPAGLKKYLDKKSDKSENNSTSFSSKYLTRLDTNKFPPPQGPSINLEPILIFNFFTLFDILHLRIVKIKNF